MVGLGKSSTTSSTLQIVLKNIENYFVSGKLTGLYFAQDVASGKARTNERGE
jgi:hypothetical protein